MSKCRFCAYTAARKCSQCEQGICYQHSYLVDGLMLCPLDYRDFVKKSVALIL